MYLIQHIDNHFYKAKVLTEEMKRRCFDGFIEIIDLDTLCYLNPWGDWRELTDYETQDNPNT